VYDQVLFKKKIVRRKGEERNMKVIPWFFFPCGLKVVNFCFFFFFSPSSLTLCSIFVMARISFKVVKCVVQAQLGTAGDIISMKEKP
jgi:hypothetical protein